MNFALILDVSRSNDDAKAYPLCRRLCQYSAESIMRLKRHSSL